MNFNKRALAPLLLSAASMAMFAGAAHAAGTTAGTTITNTVDLSYDSGGGTITRANAASVDFMVDRKVDFALVGQAATDTNAVEQGAADQEMVFLVNNEGNAPSGYDIDVSASGTVGLTYDPTGSGAEGTYSVYTSPNATGGPDTLYDVTGTVNAGDIAADANFYVRIIAHIPENATDGDFDTFNVTATALDPGTTTPSAELRTAGINAQDTLLAEGDLATETPDGKVTDTEYYMVQAPDLSAAKSVLVLSENLDGNFDCLNGTAEAGAAIFTPGACVEYSISVSNAGSSGAANLTLTDDIPTSMTFVAITDIVGFTSVTEDAGTVTATHTSLANGDTASFKIRATVD
jgi:uncharacterized repeat protein (TIGR01451 family)